MTAGQQVTISVVSHRQNALVNQLLADLAQHCASHISIVVTINFQDEVELAARGLPFPAEVIVNAVPKGFGANHNAAFGRCRTPSFCVVNPDIRVASNPFSTLLANFQATDIAVVGPLVRSPLGGTEDSARRFPTLMSLLRKAAVRNAAPDYPSDKGPLVVDWIAGMFMLFRSADYRAIGGFDERYFLYYEDADICRRLVRQGKRVIYDPQVAIVHDARRASRRDARLAAHHLASMLRFLARS
ncbi:MAG: glycosyltransferase family 2 protein [Betaproteobacteria bacterium]|nr:MAG: glycosyltransferase family 2 protein [Betaproteobacteria bacterium]